MSLAFIFWYNNYCITISNRVSSSAILEAFWQPKYIFDKFVPLVAKEEGEKLPLTILWGKAKHLKNSTKFT